MLMRTATYVDPDVMPLSADAGVRQMQMAVAEGVRYIDGGWQTLVDGLLDVCRERGVEIETRTSALSVRECDGAVQVTTAAGSWSAGAAIIASGGPRAAMGLLGSDPGWGDLGDPVTAACLDLGLTRPGERPVLFGLSEPLYLSTHCPPADLAPEGGAVVHVMRYGARDAATDRDELTRLAAAAGIDRVDRGARALPRPHARSRGRCPRRRPEDFPEGRRSQSPGTSGCSSPATGSARSGCSPTRPWRAEQPRPSALGSASCPSPRHAEPSGA